MAKVKFGQLLVQKGLIEEEELEEALEYQEEHGGKLGEILIEKGLLSHREVTDILSTQLKMPKVFLQPSKMDEEVVMSLPKDICVKYNMIPFKREEGSIWVAMEDPLNALGLEQIKMETNEEIKPALAPKNEVENALSFFFSAERLTPDSLEGDIDLEFRSAQDTLGPESLDSKADRDSIGGYVTLDPEKLSNKADKEIIGRYVNFLLTKAYEAGSSEIHLENDEGVSRVRFRIDGIMEEKYLIPPRFHNPIVAKIKRFANLDIEEREASQIGSLIMQMDDERISCSVRTIPAFKGENLIVRFFIQDPSRLSIEKIGLSDSDTKYLAKQLRSSSGVIFVAATTSEQKIRILYSLLAEMNTVYRKTVTIESLIRFKFPIITQIQLQPEKGMDFDKSFSLALNQDPDVLFIDEITDEAVLKRVMQLGVSGKLILTSIPSKDTFNAVRRLAEMGVHPSLIREATNFLMSFHKLKKLCENCKESYEHSRGSRKITLYKADGCPQCENRGFIGTTEVYELLKGDVLEADKIDDYTDESKLRRIAKEKGQSTLRQKGIKLAREGEVSIDEIYKTVS